MAACSTKTKAELATSVMRHLNLIDATEDESDHAEDSTFIQGEYDDVYDELASRELAYWTSTAIPTDVFAAVRDLVAVQVSGAYGMPVPPEVTDARWDTILKRIRRLTREQSTGAPVAVEFF